MGTSPGWHGDNYWWGEGVQGGFNVKGSKGWGMVPEGVFYHYSPNDDEFHGAPAVGNFTFKLTSDGQYNYTNSDRGEFYMASDAAQHHGPDWMYNREYDSHGYGKNTIGGWGDPDRGRVIPWNQGNFTYQHGAFENYSRPQIADEDREMPEYTPRELAPGEYAPLYESPGGNLGYQTFDVGMAPSPYAPQGINYTLPVPQAPELQTGPGVEARTMEIAEEWLRGRNRWAVPGATEGKYRERSGWSSKSSEEVRRKVATWDYNTREKYYSGFQKQALQEQAEQQQRYAKYQNELRYSQGLLLKEQAMQNIMGQIVGLGDQERRDIESEFERKQAEEIQASMGRGMASSTVLGSISRGLQSEEAEAKGRLEERLRREQAQTQALLVGDVTSWIEGRVDEYPSSESMANIMFGYGSGGAGSEQAKSKDTSGGAAAGAALGCLLGGCCFLFRHARHRDGTEDWVIREYRDNMTNTQQMRGYYKMSEFLCPLMDRHWFIRYAVKLLICDPLVAYGKWFYRNHEYYADKKKGLGHRLGWVFAPVKKFWLKTWKHLGDEFEYIRWNGEVV